MYGAGGVRADGVRRTSACGCSASRAATSGAAHRATSATTRMSVSAMSASTTSGGSPGQAASFSRCSTTGSAAKRRAHPGRPIPWSSRARAASGRARGSMSAAVSRPSYARCTALSSTRAAKATAWARLRSARTARCAATTASAMAISRSTSSVGSFSFAASPHRGGSRRASCRGLERSASGFRARGGAPDDSFWPRGTSSWRTTARGAS